MNKKIKAKWLKALRSGKYKQGKNCLTRDGRYCCLGVLCEVVEPGSASELYSFLPKKISELVGISGNGQLPGNAPKEFFGIDGKGCNKNAALSAFNDRGLSFKRIAMLIEKYL